MFPFFTNRMLLINLKRALNQSLSLINMQTLDLTQFRPGLTHLDKKKFTNLLLTNQKQIDLFDSFYNGDIFSLKFSLNTSEAEVVFNLVSLCVCHMHRKIHGTLKYNEIQMHWLLLKLTIKLLTNDSLKKTRKHN